MPDLNEFFKDKQQEEVNSTFEKIPGLKPCSSCDEDVDGGLWDLENYTMSWTCSKGHVSTHKVNF